MATVLTIGHSTHEAASFAEFLMCAEAPWWRCHRRLLADALVARGAQVLHIDARGAPEPHELTAAAVAQGGRSITSSLISGRSTSVPSPRCSTTS